jgi:Skp family chaperone for outer membrane proteins
MKYRRLFGLFLISLCLKAYADTNRVAVFDSKAVWDAVPSFQSPKKELEDTLSKFQSTYADVEKALKEEGHLLQQERLALDEGAKDQACAKDKEARIKKFEQKWNAFNTKVLAIQKTVEAKKRCIGEGYEQANQALEKTLQETVEFLAKQKGIAVVLLKESVTFVSPDLDITEEIIKVLKTKNLSPLTLAHCERVKDE